MKKLTTLIALVAVSIYGLKAQNISQSSTQYNGNIYHTGGNVGIGTTNPFAGLTINKGGDAAPFFGIGSAAWGWHLYERTADGDILFKASNNSILTDVLTLRRANGNVGIGTTNPSHKLDINTGGANVKTYHYGLETTVNTNGGWARALRFRNEYDNKTAVFGGLHGMAYIATGFDPNNDPTGYMSARLIIDYNGNVGIGTTTPQSKLAVNGTITTKEVNVTLDGWADFVFHPTYKLRTLGEVEQFIKANSHLPEIPSAAEVKENGVSLGEMNAKLLQKVEELTLYMIEQQKEIDGLKQEVKILKNK